MEMMIKTTKKITNQLYIKPILLHTCGKEYDLERLAKLPLPMETILLPTP
jgi:hypothetical protein